MPKIEICTVSSHSNDRGSMALTIVVKRDSVTGALGNVLALYEGHAQVITLHIS